MMPDTIRLPAEVANLEAANAFVEACHARAGLGGEKTFKVLLALEEAFVNICHYAYPESSGDVDIACRSDNGVFVLELADSGRPFDILSLPDPDTTLTIEDRPVGGLGVLLIRTLSRPSYRREGSRNILRMTFAA